MREGFELSDTPPVTPGDSPFHVRGRYYNRLLGRASRLPGGKPAFLAEVKDERVRAFLAQKFLWNGWYDALPTMPAHAAAARLGGRDFEEDVTDGGRAAARELVPRFFRFIAKVTTPDALAGQIVALVMHATDFVQVSFERVQDGHLLATGTGIPRYIAPNIAALVVGWFTGMLEVVGATDARGKVVDVSADASRGELEIVKIRFEFHWRPKGAR